jgi:hypothetical protein
MRLSGGQPVAEPEPPTVAPFLWVTRAQLRALRRHLLRPDGREYMAYAFCRVVAVDDLQIVEVLAATDRDYRSHGPEHIRLTTDFQIRAKSRCRALDPAAVIQIHSHPFSREGWFSRVDDADFPEIAYDFVNASPDVRCGRWVWGRSLRRSRLEIGGPACLALGGLRRANFRVAASAGAPAPVPSQVRPPEGGAPRG